jgi:hypothetical protein
MKSLRFLLALAMLALPAAALAQNAPAPASNDAAKSFTQFKSDFAGNWEGTVTTDPKDPSVEGHKAQVTLRVTSLGNALLHELHVDGRPDDPITMFYLNDGQLTLTHYCDAGNRPRMTGTQPAAERFEFELKDVAGPLTYGHMHGSAFTMVDADHHLEYWTFMSDGQPVKVRFDLHRVK